MSDNWLDEKPLPPQAPFEGPDLEAEVRLGQDCAALLNSEVYQRVQAAVRETTLQAFVTTPVRDQEGLLYLRLLIKTQDDMHQLLVDTVNTAKMSAEQLREKAKEPY